LEVAAGSLAEGTFTMYRYFSFLGFLTEKVPVWQRSSYGHTVFLVAIFLQMVVSLPLIHITYSASSKLVPSAFHFHRLKQ
jgi:hypothetical protein